MAQSLSSQLGQLQHSQKQHASLLLTQNVSSQTDLETIYHLGCKGINKLIQIDQRFTPFQETLFNVQNKGISRQLSNKQQNIQLDTELKKFLLLISQWWSFEGAHQAMEYLLRNYRIHEYCVNEVIIYFLVYHNTKLYVRLLQNLIDQQRNTLWGFFYEPISRGQQITRELLIRQIQLDYRILKQILEYQCLILLQENEIQQEFTFNVQEYSYSEEEIERIKLRQPNQLAFVYSILQDLKVTSGYMDQLRGSLGKLLAICLEKDNAESRSFAYLIFNLQLFDSSKVILTENQIHNTAQWSYNQLINNINLIDLCVLFYQFGIKTDTQSSLILLNVDLSRFYDNGLLLLEILKEIKNIVIPDKQLNQLIIYLKNLLNKNNIQFLDALVQNIPNQVISIVRPYLQDTQYKKLFPKYNELYLTLENPNEILQSLKSIGQQISIGTLTNLIEDSINYLIKSEDFIFLEILSECINIGDIHFPQTCVCSNERLELIIQKLSQFKGRNLIKNELSKIIVYVHKKNQNLNKIKTLLLINVHFNIEFTNYIIKSLKILGNQETSEQFINLINEKYPQLIKQIFQEKSKRLLDQQLKIQIAFILKKQKLLNKLIDEYQNKDDFIYNIFSQISLIDLLNLNNQYSIIYLKQNIIDPNLFFNNKINQYGKLKILLHKSSRNVIFVLKLFLIYNNLNQESQELFLQLASELKEQLKQDIIINSIIFSKDILQKTILTLLKNRKESNYTKNLSNLKDIQSLLSLELLYLQNFTDLRILQINTISNTIKNSKQKINEDDLQNIIKFIENNFENDMIEGYLTILQIKIKLYKTFDFTFLKKKIFTLEQQYAPILNKQLEFIDIYPSDIRTQMVIFVYSKYIPQKTIIVQQDLDFGMIIKLLETTNLEILSHLIDLLIANIQYISNDIIIQCFKLPFTQPAQIVQISRLIYEFLNIKQIDLLDECKNLLQFVVSQNYDLTNQLNYAAMSSCIKLIAKHTQIKKAKKAFKSIIKPQLNEKNQQNILLFYRIVAEQFQYHNIQFFNQTTYAYLMSQITYIISTMEPNQELLQNYSLFQKEQWWVILYIISITYLNEDHIKLFKDQIDKFPQDIKLQLMTSLSESLFYRTQKHQKILKIKLGQKLTQIQTPYLESCIKKIGTAIRSKLTYIKIKLSLLRILELIDSIQISIKKYLLTSDLNEKQANFLKSFIVYIQKFSNVFSHSKLKILSERIRQQMIHSLKIETLVPLISNCLSIKSVSNILLQAFNDILRIEVVKINKQQGLLIKNLIQQIILGLDQSKPNITTEILLCLNYLFNIPQIQKTLLQEGQTLIEKLLNHINDQNSQDQSLIINLFSLVSQKDHYSQLDKLNQTFELLITLLIEEYSLERINNQFQFKNEKIILKQSNKLILQTAANNIIKTFQGLISRQQLSEIIILYLIDPFKNGLELILDSIEKRILIDIYIYNTLKQVRQLTSQIVTNSLINLSELIKLSDTELINENYLQLNKELLEIFDYSREQFIDSEIKQGIFDADKLEDRVNSVYLELVLKINDIQLKKLYSSLILWSGKQLSNAGYHYLKYRRITFFRLSNQISDKLGKYFTKYYSYIWDAIVNELQTFHNIFYETPKQTKLQKRTIDECDMFYKLELLLNKHILQCISSLCQNDCEQFIDTEKFEKLSQPLAEVLDCPKVNQYEDVLQYIEEWISPTILALFQLISDDYKWKDLHHKILYVISRHSNKKNQVSSLISIGIVKLIHTLIDQLDERYLVLMNDLIPFLHQLTKTTLNSEELEKRVKQLIIRLSQLSGEDIYNSLK